MVQDDGRTTQTASSMSLMQNEPSIAINPHKPTNIIVGYNDASPLPGSCLRGHYSVSTNGGTTWASGTPLPTAGLVASRCTNQNTPTGYICCDTAIAFDSIGDAFLATMSWNNQILLYASTPDGSGNAGTSWNGPYIVGSGVIDKPAITVDRTGGAHNGNIYITWVDYYAGTGACGGSTNTNDRILVRTATLGGGGVPAFTGAAVQASDPASAFNWGPAITVAPSGSLYVAYQRMSTLCLSPANAIMISRSDDGGTTFALRGGVVDGAPVSPPFSFSSSRASAIPTITTTTNGTVFVAWTDSGAGNMDIQSRTSLTNGASWNPRVRVNNVATNDQFLPAATYTFGSIYVFYYSRESDMANIRGGLYVSTSGNGGASFTAATPFSSTFSNPNVCGAISGLYWSPCLWGDYIGAASASTGISSSEACAVWADGRDSFSAGDNDVNVYFKCNYNNIFYAHTSYWWLIDRAPPAAYIPANICIIYPPACITRWTAMILPTLGTVGSQFVSLAAMNLPPGVKASITPNVGYPPFNATISLNFTNAQCTSKQCLNTITLSATDGTNSSSIDTNEILSTLPYLITDTNVYNPGQSVNLTGIGFTPSSPITVKLDGSTAGSAKTGNDGGFNLAISLPTALQNGQHTLLATDSQSKTANTTIITPVVSYETDTGIKTQAPPTPLSPTAILLLATTISAIAAIPLSRRRRLASSR